VRHARIAAEANPVPAPPRPRKGWRRFVKQFGWRAYALPVLAVLTVLALFTTNTNSDRRAVGLPVPKTATVAAPPTAEPSGTIATDTPTTGFNNEVLASDALPAGAAYTAQGTGTFSVIPAPAGTAGVIIGTAGPVETFDIEVENGVTGIDLNAFAATVMQTLSDSRSWVGGKNVRLERVASGPTDFEISLTSSMTVRQLCGYDIQIETSCFAPTFSNRVVINNARWVRGDVSYGPDIASYRQYVINHETGHALGHSHAHECLTGKVPLAPVMMQQTIGLKTVSGQTCAPNQWPYPPGVTDAPGAEQPASSGADQAFVNQNT
jgi:hypothetical protein